MLTRRSVGPRVSAVGSVGVVAIPAEVAESAFASAPGARFLAAQSSYAQPRIGPPSYSLVRKITETGAPCAVVTGIADDQGPGFGLVTDALLRQHVIVGGMPPSSPVSMILDTDVTVAQLGDSAAEALITMLDRDAEVMLVLDRNQRLVEELHQRSRRVAPMLADLLSRGLASGKVIAVHSAILDTIVRRALVLTFADEPEVSLDAFTWLGLGSNGRREAVAGSDVDSAVAFDDDLTETEMARYRTVFGRVDRVLSETGLIADDHGATPARAPFANSGASWRSVARSWLAAPAHNQGAIMTSLLVNGRPIHGDPGLPAVASVFGDLRAHPGTMCRLLQKSLSKRARLRSFGTCSPAGTPSTSRPTPYCPSSIWPAGRP